MEKMPKEYFRMWEAIRKTSPNVGEIKKFIDEHSTVFTDDQLAAYENVLTQAAIKSSKSGIEGFPEKISADYFKLSQYVARIAAERINLDDLKDPSKKDVEDVIYALRVFSRGGRKVETGQIEKVIEKNLGRLTKNNLSTIETYLSAGASRLRRQNDPCASVYSNALGYVSLILFNSK